MVDIFTKSEMLYLREILIKHRDRQIDHGFTGIQPQKLIEKIDIELSD